MLVQFPASSVLECRAFTYQRAYLCVHALMHTVLPCPGSACLVRSAYAPFVSLLPVSPLHPDLPRHNPQAFDRGGCLGLTRTAPEVRCPGRCSRLDVSPFRWLARKKVTSSSRQETEGDRVMYRQRRCNGGHAGCVKGPEGSIDVHQGENAPPVRNGSRDTDARHSEATKRRE